MGQCLCTLCTLPICCVGRAAAPSLGRRALVVGGMLTALGTFAFGVLSVRCGGVDFYGGGGNPCWSEGASKEEHWGLAAAAGLGLGVPALLYGARRATPPRELAVVVATEP